MGGREEPSSTEPIEPRGVKLDTKVVSDERGKGSGTNLS